MGRINCLSRKAAAADPPPVPSRPVYAISHRPRAEYINPNIQPLVQVNQPPLNRRTPLEAAPNAMKNAVRRGADRGMVPPRNYIEISDDEDFDDGVGAVGGTAAPRLQNPASKRSNARAELSPSPAPKGNSQPQPGATPSPPGQDQEDEDLRTFFMEHDDDDEDELDVNDPLLAQFMMEDFNRDHDQETTRSPQPVIQLLADQQNQQEPRAMVESRVQCFDQVLMVFPDICQDYVTELYTTVAQSSDFIIVHVLDKIDKGTHYPKARDTQKTLKRKRELDEDEEAVRKYGSADRVIPEGAAGLRPYIRGLVSKDFPETPMNFIDSALNQSGYRLFSTYRVLEEAHRTFDPHRPPYNKIKYQRKIEDEYRDANLEGTILRMMENAYQDQEVEILRELQAARRIRKKAEAKREAELQAEIEEERNIRKAEAEGTMSECGCCFSDFPLNRMVHCDNDKILHWFCRGCAKQNADTEIGSSKYELRCMSMDGCSAGFSLDQRNQFLDETTVIALERNEQEAVLRMAGIENLASCPFCPYAAEYPPIEIDREFRCQAPDCEKTSCRLCKVESHIPKSCEEHAKDTGLSVRRQIEEAMSAALIRKCNKCGTPFVKEEGCNKMTCTRNGCFNVQCYICSKSCQYDHFDDTRRGGKTGNCPLFESVEDRHDSEVKRAEKEALDKVRAKHPEYTEEDLKVKMSENVKRDDERRKANDPRNRNLAAGVGVPAGPAAMIYGFGLPPVYPGAAPVMQPIAPPFYPGRVVHVPEYAQDIFVDAHVDGHFDDELFVGLWDNLPGLGLEQPDQIGGPPVGQPPPALRLRPQLQRFEILPHRAPQPGVNQPVPAGVQAGNMQNLAPPAQLNVPPQAREWRVGANVLVGGQPLPELPRRSPRVANPGNQAPQLRIGYDNQPFVEQRQHIQDLRVNFADLHRTTNNIAPPQPGNMSAQQMMQEQQRQLQQLQANGRDLPWGFQPNGGFDGFQQDAELPRAAPQMPGAAGARISRHARREAPRPINPPNRQA